MLLTGILKCFGLKMSIYARDIISFIHMVFWMDMLPCSYLGIVLFEMIFRSVDIQQFVLK